MWRLAKRYRARFEMTPSAFWKLSDEQRRKHIERWIKATMTEEKPLTVTSSNNQLNVPNKLTIGRKPNSTKGVRSSKTTPRVHPKKSNKSRSTISAGETLSQQTYDNFDHETDYSKGGFVVALPINIVLF